MREIQNHDYKQRRCCKWLTYFKLDLCFSLCLHDFKGRSLAIGIGHCRFTSYFSETLDMHPGEKNQDKLKCGKIRKSRKFWYIKSNMFYSKVKHWPPHVVVNGLNALCIG